MTLKNGLGLEVAGFTLLTTDELSNIQGGGLWKDLFKPVGWVNDLINPDPPDSGGGGGGGGGCCRDYCCC